MLSNKLLRAYVLPLLFLTIVAVNQGSGQCSMSCNNNLNVSLSSTCQQEITADLIVEAAPNCDPSTPDAFAITVYNSFGTLPLPTSPVVTNAQIGQTLSVKATHLSSGNSCWGSITIYDQLAPVITCPPNQTVSCNQPIGPDLMGYAFVLDCSPYTTSHYDSYQDLGCNDPMGIVSRTWLSTDSYGNMSSCVQTFTVQQATLGNVTFPPNLDGIALPALPCTTPNTDPSNTSVPTIDGEPIPQSGSCSISSLYADQVVPTCGNSFTVLRTWTVLEWCTGNLQQATQVIAVKDLVAPVLTGPDTLFMPANDPLSCTGTFLLPQVTFSDNCSDA
ncbi:MAG: hypothetical protein KDC44_12870, partial [Phaeodactylibacter sp.]|nr:hypothetical protein [Phaeodactylibacter sp.]